MSTITTNPVTVTTIPDSTLGQMLQAAIARAEAAEAKVARIDDYMRYVAQSLDANCVVRPFEEWFSRR